MTKDQTRNLSPHLAARFAMLHWGKEYAAQGGGSMDFWDSLSNRQKRYAIEAVEQLIAHYELQIEIRHTKSGLIKMVHITDNE